MQSIMTRITRCFVPTVRIVALILAVGATSGVWAVKLGEGITAYYDCETVRSNPMQITVVGKEWDSSSASLVSDDELLFGWSGNGIGNRGQYGQKFNNCYSGGGTGARCYDSQVCAGLCPGTSSGDWTFSFWVVRNSATTQRRLFVNSQNVLNSYTDSNIASASTENAGFGIYLESNGKIGVRLSETTDGSAFKIVSIVSSGSYTWNASTWHNVIVSRSGDTLTLYVDGAVAGAATMTTGSYLVDPSHLTMAEGSTSVVGPQNGADDFCVWNRALSQAEVAAIAGGSAPISELAGEEFFYTFSFSNVDSDSLAVNSDDNFGTTSFSFQLNNPSSNAATADFPASGYVQLTKISIGACSDNDSQSITTATLTNNKTTESYTATVSYSSGNDFTAIKPNSWSRKEVKLVFDTVGVLVDTTATYTLTFKNSEGTTTELECSGVTTVASGTQTGDWTPAMRIYGCTPSGSMEMPSSLIPSSGGMALPTTVTVADATGMAFANDSVTIGKSGIPIALASALDTQTVMVKAVIPSSSSRLIGWKVSDDYEAYTSYTGSQFEQHYLNNGSVYNTTYGTWPWTHDANEHWVAVAYDRGSDTSTYLDGAKRITNTSLKWYSLQTLKVTIGGTAYNTTDAATGMVIKDVQIYNQSLGSERVATVTAALNKGWTVNAAGTTLTTTTLRELPNNANVQAICSLTVAADGTYSASGLTEVKVLEGGSFDIGTSRPTILGVAAGGTLAVASDATITMSERIAGYTPTATLTVLGDIAGTVTFDGVTVTPVIDGSTATLTGTAVVGNPSYTGDAWWWDYEFNGNGNNIGSEGVELQWDDDRPLQGSEYTTADETGNQMLHLPARPWRNVETAYPSEFTAVMFCKAGATANGVLVAFGSTTKGSTETITLSTGAKPSAGQMRLVYGSGQNNSTDLVEGGFTLDNITSANHLYAFTVKTVGGGSQIAVYADGDLLTTYTADSPISLGSGFQIASGHGGLPSSLSRLADDDAATMDFLRVSNVALSEAAIKAMAAEYRYVSPNGIAERTLSANATWTDETNNSWSQKTLNEDGSTTTTEQAAPKSGTVVEITASTDVQLTMDLASAVSYEKLTFQGDGAITVKAGGTAPRVTTRTYINTGVTMDIAAFSSFGAITVADGKTLMVVPDEESTLDAGIALGIRGETSTILTGTVTLGTGSQVVLLPSMVSKFASYGFTLTLTPDASGRYVYTIARDDNPVHITKAVDGTVTYAMYPDGLSESVVADMTLPAEPETIPADFASTVTIVNNHASEPLTVATAFAGGNVTVSSGTVVLSGAITTSGTLTFNGATTLSGEVTLNRSLSGSADVTVSGTVTVADGATYGKTLKGTGTVDFSNCSSLPGALTFSSWTGTVVLPSFRAAGQKLTDYGTSGSKIKIKGITEGYLYTENQNIESEIVLAGNFTITDMSEKVYTFAKFSGEGNISFSPGTYELTSLTITELAEGYSGTVVNNMRNTTLTIGKLALPANASVVYGTKLLPTGGTGKIQVNSVTVGGVETALGLAYKADGVYVKSPGFMLLAY